MTFLIAFMLLAPPQALSPAPSPAPPQLPGAQIAGLLERLGCAPVGLPAPPAAGLRVLGGHIHGRNMFGPGEATIISGGTNHGVQRGQQYFVRRVMADPSTTQPKTGALYGIHTAGWVTIVDAKENMAVASVTHACDGILEGDFLEPYSAPVLPTVSLSGAPDYEHPGQIVLADERRQNGYPGLVMMMNRGTDQGVRAGQQVTIYRETLGGQGPIVDVGRATVVSANPQSSIVHITSIRDVIYLGDLVAIHRITP